MKARIHVFYKDSVFDPQGNTVGESLKKMGFQKVKGVRIGRVIDLEIDYSSKEEARKDIQRMCEKLLANPVIESFKPEIIDP
ncbi:MAG: phosphoribosylformylglycinamidine synthase subunit PurS [Proteobacteria bacterium]|nr:phosphoribosylformylglycinamidine synthase subunit PurS [Pseudomonadota bacterium]NBY20243.1 phosphoribosylformylglycinamidine synthase subunit PurS [bacterium]